MTPLYEEEISLDAAINWCVQHAGFPTFDEFRKNPDQYRLSPEHVFEAADGSTIAFRKQNKKQEQWWKDEYPCDSLEQVQRIAKEEGYSEADLEMEVIGRLMYGTNPDHDMEFVVRYWPKSELRARGGIIANDLSSQRLWLPSGHSEEYERD